MTDPNWNDAVTLEESIIRIIKREGTESPTLKPLEAVYGRERITIIWQEHLERGKKSDGNPS